MLFSLRSNNKHHSATQIIYRRDVTVTCSNVITREQASRISNQAREIGVPVGVMFDNDTEGENGARASIPLLAEFGPVQYTWSPLMFDGEFKNRQPESMTFSDLKTILNI
ncbi:toprim domain-containing protein [Gimesia panareensis]|uniref:hypothetical protein n=1 Tax=Gimesia panareensis TaxID=2527978 RepID=UPI0011A3BFE1|nr:hypothetical protein [Gimesia panareensis]